MVKIETIYKGYNFYMDYRRVKKTRSLRLPGPADPKAKTGGMFILSNKILLDSSENYNAEHNYNNLQTKIIKTALFASFEGYRNAYKNAYKNRYLTILPASVKWFTLVQEAKEIVEQVTALKLKSPDLIENPSFRLSYIFDSFF